MFVLQVRRAGETVAVAGIATLGLFAIGAMVSSLLGGSSEEKKNKQ